MQQVCTFPAVIGRLDGRIALQWHLAALLIGSILIISEMLLRTRVASRQAAYPLGRWSFAKHQPLNSYRKFRIRWVGFFHLCGHLQRLLADQHAATFQIRFGSHTMSVWQWADSVLWSRSRINPREDPAFHSECRLDDARSKIWTWTILLTKFRHLQRRRSSKRLRMPIGKDLPQCLARITRIWLLCSRPGRQVFQLPTCSYLQLGATGSDEEVA